MFGTSSGGGTTGSASGTGGVGELLLGGASGFGNTGAGSSLANGYGNDGASQASGGGTPAPSASSTFDLNDFPSLGGGVAGNTQGGANGLSAAFRQQQQQMLVHQQMLGGSGTKNANASSNLYRLAMQSGNNANFKIATEDFPALPGAPGGGSGGGGENGALSGTTSSSLLLVGGGNSAASLSTTTFGGPSRVGSGGNGVGGLYNGTELDSGSGQRDGASGLLEGGGLPGLGPLTNLQTQTNGSTSVQQPPQQQARTTAPTTNTGSNATNQNASSNAPTPSSSAAASALSGDFGLLGLLSVIRMTDADRNALALGTDLTMLGLNLNSNDNLYSNFSSPWSETPATKEPHFQLPMCYYNEPPALKTGHLSKFQLETLFYIFYALPKDILQAYSAQELYTREWRYHTELKRWFKRATQQDVPNNSSGAPQFLYFDISTWERRLFTGNMGNITNGFLSEEEVRVKFPQS